MQMDREKSSSFEASLARRLKSFTASAIILDLDDTVYWENRFLRSALGEVRSVFKNFAGKQTANKLVSAIWDLYSAGDTKNMFQSALTGSGLPADKALTIIEILEHHTVPGGLAIRDWLQIALPELSVPVGILTNGNPAIQSNKLRNLNPGRLVENLPTVYANQVMPKPSPLGIFVLAELWSIEPTRILLVGDSVADANAAKAGGCQFLRSV